MEVGREEGGLAAELEEGEASEVGVEGEVEGGSEKVGSVEVGATE